MRLAPKIFLPVAGVLTVVAMTALGLGVLLIQSLQNHLLERLAQGYEVTVQLAMDRSIDEARNLAAVFLRLPEVEAAYRLALSGNIHDEADPTVQEARQSLRRALAPMLSGYAAATGTKLKLHFHLPNGRSLVRLWQPVNFQKGTTQLDISDDISAFRQTVVEANAKRQPQQGLEVGVGGLSLRNVQPVTAADGTHLGSAEVLMDMDLLFEEASRRLQVDMAIFIDDRLLPIAVQFQDPAKHPHIGSFVQVRAPHSPETVQALDASWLAQGLQKRATRQHGTRFLTAVPLQDFSGNPVGVLVLSQDITSMTALLKRAGGAAAMAIIAILAGVLLVVYLTVRIVVLKPLAHLTQAALAIRNGQLDTTI